MNKYSTEDDRVKQIDVETANKIIQCQSSPIKITEDQKNEPEGSTESKPKIENNTLDMIPEHSVKEFEEQKDRLEVMPAFNHWA
mgnify:FL=1